MKCSLGDFSDNWYNELQSLKYKYHDSYSDYTQNVKILSISNRSVTCVLYHNIYDVQLLQNNKVND